MPKFLVLYLAPSSVIETWSKTDPEIRKPAEAKMRAAWGAWMAFNAYRLSVTEAIGATKRVSPESVSDTKNDVMLYSFVEADSHAAAAQMFEDHPHLQIPRASIEVMEVRPVTGL